jgi:DNA-binding MarR family transcriptional regulator
LHVHGSTNGLPPSHCESRVRKLQGFPEIVKSLAKTAEPVVCAQGTLLWRVATAGHQVQPRTKFIVDREKSGELSVKNCLESVGISLLSEWDVLAFVYRHGVSLTSIGQIACLVGYESTVVAGALDRLERERLIERSRESQGVRFYRLFASMDAKRRHCLQQLISLSEGRAGRLLLANRLKPMWSELGQKNDQLGLEE